MSLIDKATAHFNAKTVRSLYVPEWDVEVFAHPLTMADKGKWLTRASGSNTDYLVYAVIFGAKDREGNALFSIEDKAALRENCDSEVVSTVASFVLSSDNATEEEREKN